MLAPNAVALYIAVLMSAEERAKNAARQRRYRERNKSKVRARERAWDEANRAKRNAISKAWRERNPEQMKAICQAYDAANRDRRIAHMRAYKKRTWETRRAHEKAYYAAHPEKALAKYKKYRQRHPEKVIESTAIRRARINGGAIVKFTVTQLRARLSMYGGRCWMCGKPGKQVDHVIPLAKGGPHVLANLRPACGKCNRKKGARRLTQRTT